MFKLLFILKNNHLLIDTALNNNLTMLLPFLTHNGRLIGVVVNT